MSGTERETLSAETQRWLDRVEVEHGVCKAHPFVVGGLSLLLRFQLASLSNTSKKFDWLLALVAAVVGGMAVKYL